MSGFWFWGALLPRVYMVVGSGERGEHFEIPRAFEIKVTNMFAITANCLQKTQEVSRISGFSSKPYQSINMPIMYIKLIDSKRKKQEPSIFKVYLAQAHL